MTPACPMGVSFLFALKWFENHTCIIFSNTFHMLTVGTLCTTVCINYVMQFRLWPYIIYLILNLLHYSIKSYFYHYYSPQIVLSFVCPILCSSTSTCHVTGLNPLCVNASGWCHEFFVSRDRGETSTRLTLKKLHGWFQLWASSKIKYQFLLNLWRALEKKCSQKYLNVK